MLNLLAELTILVGASATIAYIGQRFFGIVPLVGFLITGVAIGPNALGLVADERLVESAAEIGVILLLFTIGIEFSLERLARIRRMIIQGGTLQLLLTVGLMTVVLSGLGVSWQAAVYTGCLAALSSTVIALKLLADAGDTSSQRGQAALGILIFQDMAVVGMVLLLPVLAGQGGGATEVMIALGKAFAIIAFVLLLARRAMPALLEFIARACSPDIFLLTLIAVCFGTAWVASLAGLGVSLGAFLAGLIVSESSFSEHALSEILPLRILFSVAFFVSIGMLLDPSFVLREPLLVVAIVAGVLVLKATMTTATLLALRIPLATSLGVGLLLAQVGEFAFVLERQGTALGLYPAGSEASGGQAFIAATVVLMIATPAVSRLAPWAAAALGKRAKSSGAVDLMDDGVGSADVGPEGLILIGGYGPSARGISRSLAATGIEHLIMTLSPDGAAEAERAGHTVLRGDYSRRLILEHAGLHRAALLVVADDDVATTERVIAVARSLRPDIRIAARTSRAANEETLLHAGADIVVAAEGAADRELTRVVLESAGVAPQQIALVVAGVEPGATGMMLSREMKSSARCRHGPDTRVVFPGGNRVCPTCVATGGKWVHLRVCMSCGNVGCCDSSPGRHARKHFEETSHAVIKSWEPGEDWAWCYIDQVDL